MRTQDAAPGKSGVQNHESFTTDASQNAGRPGGHIERIQRVPDVIRYYGLTGEACALVYYIAHRDGRGNGCTVSMEDMRAEFGWSVKKMQKARKLLRDSGAVEFRAHVGAPTSLHVIWPDEPSRYPPGATADHDSRRTPAGLRSPYPPGATHNKKRTGTCGSVAPTLPLAELLAGHVAGVLATSSGMPDDALDGYGLTAETVADLSRVVEQERAAALDRTGDIPGNEVFLEAADRLAADDELTENVAARYRQVFRTGPLRKWEAGY